MSEPASPHLPDLAALRIDYKRQSLSEHDVLDDPIAQFVRWLDDAIAGGAHEPNAMTLATASAADGPSARIVLLKGVDPSGFVFFTNYRSRKGRDLTENPRAALLFYWPELERQVRVEGTVSQTSERESADYFASRPPAARVGSAASPQSDPIESRDVLEALERDILRQHPDGNVPCPAHWGGYRVTPHKIEFWQGRPSRLHDRVEYLRHQKTGAWTRRRLAP